MIINLKKLILIVSISIAWVKPCLAQNDFGRNKTDSLLKILALKKGTKDSIQILQQLVDLTPIRQSETVRYPDRLTPLLKLNSQVKLIDPTPYQLIQDGENYWNQKQYAQALKSLQGAVDIFDKQHKSIVPLLMDVRLLYNWLGKQDARLQYYKQKLNYYLVNGPVENTAPCYHSIAYFYFIKGAYNQAISNYLEGAAVFRRYDPHYYCNAIGVVGQCYTQWGNVTKASQYLNYVLPIAKRINDADVLGTAYYGLALTAYIKKQYNEALTLVNKEIALELLLSQRTATIYAFKAQIYLSLGQPALALPVLNRAKAMADSGLFKTVNNFGDMEIDFGYYRYYRLTGNLNKAQAWLLTALKNVTEQNSLNLELKYLKELGNFYARQNKPQLSEKYMTQYFEIDGAREQTLNKYKVAQYEIDQNDKQQRSNITRLKQEKAVQNVLLWASAVVVALILGSLVFIYRQLRINKKTLFTLRRTQTQLIQSEKMASLGELTAGIAHEIQNPLNFVNNFSEVNTELIGEMKLEIEKGDLDEIKAIALDIEENSKKINQHGKRADAIVKGMLLHSQSGTGTKEPTDINALADEVMRLAYHGLRTKNKSFIAELVTNFYTGMPAANIIPQDISRVMLNLFNNAFYAVNQKSKNAGADYKPKISVTTSLENGQAVIKVKDNGIGISDAIKEKIMQPFFTTKPTGEGTGLGLSLTYDIVVKGHEGNITVNSVEGEGSEFIVTLPTG